MVSENVLVDGIDILCKGDSDIGSLIGGRREEVLSLLERYIKEIETFNNAYGLVKVSNRDELIIKHILDSLAPLGTISRLLSADLRRTSSSAAHYPLKIADAGSGAGLPGIPLAIALSDYDFTLIERMGRRAGFLYNTTAILGLTNITIEEKELEKTESGRFNLVTFRAFSPIEPKLLETLFRSCKQNGIIAAYKGRCEKIEQEMASINQAEYTWNLIPCGVPFLNEERHLLIIRLVRQLG